MKNGSRNIDRSKLIKTKFQTDDISAGKWRRNRRIIAPTFHGKILEGYQRIFGNAATIFIDEILPKYELKKDVDWYLLLTTENLDVILRKSNNRKRKMNKEKEISIPN